MEHPHYIESTPEDQKNELCQFARNLKNSLKYLQHESDKMNLDLTSHLIEVTMLSVDDNVQEILSESVLSNFKTE